MPFAIVPFLLLVIPVVEIAVFILVGGQIGVFPTLAFIFVTAMIGSILLRVQGFSVVARIRYEMDHGRIPGRELGHGVMILAAAILLLTPGFVTDAIGFALFVPAIRSMIWRFLASHIEVEVSSAEFGAEARSGRKGAKGRVVELEPDEFHEAGADGSDEREKRGPPGRV